MVSDMFLSFNYINMFVKFCNGVCINTMLKIFIGYYNFGREV